jgi:ABC-type Mn2+/Zn2+ transport system permease subunit
MIETITEILKPDFLLHNALCASVLMGVVCPLVGAYFVLRRLVFWGVALPQIAASGISFAFLLQGLGFTLLAGSEAQERHLAIIASALFTFAAIAMLLFMERKGKGAAEGRIGVFYALAWATSILFVSTNATGETEMTSLLRGEIIAISPHDFHIMLMFFALAGLAALVFQKEFLLVSFDRDMAVTLGRKVLAWEVLLYLLIGTAISLGVMTAGPLVTFGLLVVPPMAALPWAGGIMSLSLVAAALGGLSAFVGFYFSYAKDMPLGPVIICAACAALIISAGARKAYMLLARIKA